MTTGEDREYIGSTRSRQGAPSSVCLTIFSVYLFHVHRGSRVYIAPTIVGTDFGFLSLLIASDHFFFDKVTTGYLNNGGNHNFVTTIHKSNVTVLDAISTRTAL